MGKNLQNSSYTKAVFFLTAMTRFCHHLTVKIYVTVDTINTSAGWTGQRILKKFVVKAADLQSKSSLPYNKIWLVGQISVKPRVQPSRTRAIPYFKIVFNRILRKGIIRRYHCFVMLSI